VAVALLLLHRRGLTFATASLCFVLSLMLSLSLVAEVDPEQTSDFDQA
jgi:hypothetical protein